MLGRDDSVLVQEPVCARHGVEVHPQVRRQLSYGGELISRFELTGGNLVFDLFHELNVDRDMIPKIYLDIHLPDPLLSLCMSVYLYDCLIV